MLISNNSYAAGDVVSFKLTNGDEIVGRVEQDNADSFRVERPCTVVPSQKGIMLISSLFTSEPDVTVTLSKNHVLYHAPTVKEIQSHYIQVTTGIQTVPAGSVIAGV